jgi:Ni2+-binding GTPase involved in maturation of urease and hydrogenase
LILITGPPGSGKTSVLTALADALSDDDVPHAALEVEAVAWTHPPLFRAHHRSRASRLERACRAGRTRV